MVLSLLLASLLLPSLTAAQSAGRKAKRKAFPALRLAHPTKQSRTIALDPLRNRAGAYTGHLMLLVVSRRRKRGTIAISYVQDAGRRSNPLSKRSKETVYVSGTPKRIKAPPKRTAAIPLTFTLPKGYEPSWLNGTIVLNLRKADGKTVRKPSLLIPVKAAFLPLTDLTFHPAEMTIQVTRGWPGKSESNVEMTGTGATALLDRGLAFSSSVVLGNDEGNRVSLTLRGLRRNASGGVDATVVATKPRPGEYKGAMTVGAGDKAPALSLVVNSRLAIWVAIGIVLLSAIAGGLVPLLRGVNRRRGMMRLALKSAIEHYEAVHDGYGFVHDLLWNMDDKLGPRPWLALRWSALSETQGYAGLYAKLRWARSDDELDELSDDITEAVQAIGLWVFLYEPAAALDAADKLIVPRREGKKKWEETLLALDTENLLNEIGGEPVKTMDQARALARRCFEQAKLHTLMAKAWTKLVEAEKRTSGKKHEELAAIELEGIVDFVIREPKRGRQIRNLTKRLSQMVKEIDEIAPDLGAAELDPMGDSGNTGAIQEEARKCEQERREATSVDPAGEDAESTLAGLLMMDWMVTGLIAVGAVLVYITPLYDSTWGTTPDLLAAAAVGFGSQVVVQWAGMPIFQSLRHSREEKKKQEDQGPTPVPQPQAEGSSS